MNKKAFLVLVFLAQVFNCGNPSRVTVSQGGYRNVLVALSDQIPENEAELIQSSITKLFSAASTSLKTATRDKLYFAELKVLVPQSWRTLSTELGMAEGWENFEESDFRVTTTPGDPYTVQDLGCGQQGQYVQLGKDFVIASDTDVDISTDSAMTVVREWARYRYGVFEEDGTNRPEYPDFYYNPSGQWVVNMCNNTVVGLELKNCTVNPATNNNETCEVALDSDQDPSLHSSIMTTILHNHVDGFCDINTHNSDAPNRQNVLCGQRSVWEILNRHNDFSSSSIIPPSQSITPTVTFIKPQQTRIFIHWDSSIVDDSQKDAFSHAVQEFIKVDLAASRNILLAASNNSNSPSSVKPEVVKNENADQIAHNVANFFVSEESTFDVLSNALQSVAKIWEDNDFTAMGSIIILISHRTDESPSLSETVAKLTDAGMKLHLITSEQKTVASLGPLARDTGGRIFPVTIPQDPILNVEQMQMKPLCFSQISYRVQINEALSAILNGVIVGSVDQVIEVYREIHVVGPLSSAEGTFTIDESLDSTHTDLYVYRCRDSDITIQLETPSGSPYNLKSPSSTDLGYRESNLPEVGTWSYKMSSNSKISNSLAVVLSSRRALIVNLTTTDPIVVRGWVKTTSNPDWPEVRLFASVMRGSSPVSGVCVKAIIATGNGSDSQINLLDNGRADPDIASGDGIYSRYFTSKELSSAVYQVEIVVTGGTSCGGSSAEIFTRTYSVGTFEMPQGQWDTEDPYPPGRITDLRIENPLSDSSGMVQIGWTATGEDLDEGSAFQYNVRCTSGITELELNFDQLQVINLGQVNGQPTSSVESGTRISATFIPNNSSDTVCAMKAVDKSGKSSALSNTVAIKMSANSTTDVPPPDRVRRYTRLQIIGISALSIACFIIVLLLLIVIFLCLTRRKKDKVDKKDAKKQGKNQKRVEPPEDTIFNVPVRNIRSSRISHDFDPVRGHDFGSVAGSTRDWDSDGDRDDGRSEMGSDATHSLSWVPFKPDDLNRDYFAVRNEHVHSAGLPRNITRYSRSRRRSSSPESRVESFVGSQHRRPMSAPPKPPPKSNNASQYPSALQLGVHNLGYSDSYDTGDEVESIATRRTRREIQV